MTLPAGVTDADVERAIKEMALCSELTREKDIENCVINWPAFRTMAQACLTAALAGRVVVPADRAEAATNSIRFVKWAMQEGPWEGGDLDGGATQDMAESLGLIVSVPYDPEKHGIYNNCGCDAGDPWFEFAPGLNARPATADLSVVVTPGDQG